jgi:glucan phosphoethanolaminetransferase (alkaline phosphatase superfamily)
MGMKEQNYDNHIRVYPIHHLVFYPLLGILATIAAIRAYRHPALRIEWIFITLILLLVTWLSFMLRQHYALTNQNRIVRLEMRLRFFMLTGKDFRDLEKDLSFLQIAALRFASDEELPRLIERTIREKLSPNGIKKSVTQWQADHMRV